MKPQAPPMGTEEYGRNCEMKMGASIAIAALMIILLAMALLDLFNPPNWYWTLFPLFSGGIVRWLDRRWPT